jgi:citrate lyase beta subunit
VAGEFDLDRLSDDLDARLAPADRALRAQFPGNRPERQPVHTVYVPADRFTADTCVEWGAAATAAVDRHAGMFRRLVDSDEVVELVRRKLANEPIEDLRIDFEDGYGLRPENTEDDDAGRASRALADSIGSGTAVPFRGIRIRSLESQTRRRAVRTLAGFVTTLADRGQGLDRFVVTLPKVTSIDQIEAMVYICQTLETGLGLASGALRFEIQIETPQSILGPDGSALVARMLHASDGRCAGLHYGTYDYSASCGIAAPYQSLAHPVADHAKLVMQAAAAGTGVWLSDGSTNVLPVGDTRDFDAAWQLHLQLVRRSLERGYYQGWDLHPAQLPTRHAATIGFFLAALPDAVARLRDYLGGTGSGILDEPATARALADVVVRAVHCGATSEESAVRATGLTLARLTELARPHR